MSKPLLLLIDGHALIYRAYHAFPGLSTKDGTLVNAVYGFSRIVLTAIRDFEPRYIAVAFDLPQPTFRHIAFTDYKANRAEMPDDLKPQIELVKQVVRALNIPLFEVAGYEADDVIGTLCRQLAEQRDRYPEVTGLIVTGDRDAFQLVNDDVIHVWLPARSKQQLDQEFDPKAVELKMGVRPDQIVDLKALMGDASDNIPGVPGIGEKTAVKLLQEFDTLSGVYEAVARSSPEHPASSVLTKSVLAKLIAGKDSALLSQDLARINTQAPVTLDLEACQVTSYDKAQAAELFKQLQFASLIPLLPNDEFELGVQAALF